MKPILNKEMVLEFVRTAHEKTHDMPKETSHELAIKVGRMEILDELMSLVLETI